MSQPAPKPGQLWNLREMIARGVQFATLMGSFDVQSSADAASEVPLLGNLSLHFAHLKDKADLQTPHKEDEAYFVIDGRGAIIVEGKKLLLEPGSLVFVPRCADHRFVDFEQEGLSLLVIFSPNFTG